MQKTSWDDYRIAYQVAIDGSLSKAAITLNINHTTVLRHVNQLEDSLGIKLFIRHQRGYQLTDAGFLLLNKMPQVHSQITRLQNMLCDSEGEITGILRITSVLTYSKILNPALRAFIKQHPKLRIELVSTDDIVPLESGAVHVSIRIGKKPVDGDIIVKKLTDVEFAYYATEEYVAEHGSPSSSAEFKQHFWVLPSGGKRSIPFVKHITEHIPEENVIYQSNNFPDVHQAVIDGFGIGPLDLQQAKQHPDLHKITTIDMPLSESLWFVYHRDLKHSNRVKTLYQFLSNHL